jgi:protein gp37
MATWSDARFRGKVEELMKEESNDESNDESKTDWADATWNPVRGCTKVSPGCKHCYAELFAERFRGVAGHAYEQGFDVRLVPHKLADPFTWTRRSVVFVNSMSDLFHEDVPDRYVDAVARVMEAARWHTFQVLTRRAQRLRDALAGRLARFAGLRHVWWGVSVEDRRHGLPRIDALRAAPAGLRFLSIEPLLEDLGEIDLSGIGWVIVGGESGRGARPMNAAWVRSIQRQCADTDVPFFFKQWGGEHRLRNGCTLDGRTYDGFPAGALATAPVPTRAVRARIADALELGQETWEPRLVQLRTRRPAA